MENILLNFQLNAIPVIAQDLQILFLRFTLQNSRNFLAESAITQLLGLMEYDLFNMIVAGDESIPGNIRENGMPVPIVITTMLHICQIAGNVTILVQDH